MPLYTKVNASIDFGSSSVRVILLDENGKWHHIENPIHCKKSKKLSTEEWPILLNVTSNPSDGPIWPAHVDSVTSQTVPAKIAVYFLVEDTLDTSQHDPYCNIGALLEHHNKDALRINLRRGLQELFDAVNLKIESVCNERRLQLDRIILSIPVQWGEKFQKYYREVIKEAFHIPNDLRIEFVPEIQAVAHYTFGNRQTLLANIPPGRRLEILFTDYGGHSLSTCRFFVAFDIVQGKTCFFRTQDAQGVLGGPEQWEFFVLDTLNEEAKMCSGRDRRDLQPKARLKLAQEIACEKCDRWGPLFNEPYDTTFFDEVIDTTQDKATIGRSSHHIRISAEQITSCFHQAFHEPFELVREQIQALAQQEIEVLDANELAASPKTRKKFTKEEVAAKAKVEGKDFALVVVSGSSSQNSCIKDAVEKACTEAKIKAAPIFIEDGIRSNMGLKVAQGAAMAVRDVMSPSEFIERGAAFGLQRGRKTKVAKQDEFNWDHFAALLICKEQKEVKIQFTSNGDPFRIVCQPFYGHRVGERINHKVANRLGRTTEVTYLSSNDNTAACPTLNVSETYDVASLGEPLLKGQCDPLMEGQPEPLMKGQWRLKMRLDGNCMHFKVDRSRKGEKHFILVDEFSTEMATDVGSNCVFFTCDDETIQGKTLAERFHNKPKNKHSAHTKSASQAAELPSPYQAKTPENSKRPIKGSRVAQELHTSTRDDIISISDSEQPDTPEGNSQADGLVCEEINAGSTLLFPHQDLESPDESDMYQEASNATQTHQLIVTPEDHYPELDNDQMNYEDLSGEGADGGVYSHEELNNTRFNYGESNNDGLHVEGTNGSPLYTPLTSFMHTPPREGEDNTIDDDLYRSCSYPSVTSHGLASGRAPEAQMGPFPPPPSISASYTPFEFQLLDGLPAQATTVAPMPSDEPLPQQHPSSHQKIRRKPKPNRGIRTSTTSDRRNGGSGMGRATVQPSLGEILLVPDNECVGCHRGEDVNDNNVSESTHPNSSKEPPKTRLPKRRHHSTPVLIPMRRPTKQQKAAQRNVHFEAEMK